MRVSNTIFNLARSLSKKSDHDTYRLGCVIFRKKQIISVGYNQVKTHPKSPHPFHSIHAEFHAILGVSPADLKNSSAFVYMEKKNGIIGRARPCPCCAKMLAQLGISKVYFTDSDGSIGDITL